MIGLGGNDASWRPTQALFATGLAAFLPGQSQSILSARHSFSALQPTKLYGSQGSDQCRLPFSSAPVLWLTGSIP